MVSLTSRQPALNIEMLKTNYSQLTSLKSSQIVLLAATDTKGLRTRYLSILILKHGKLQQFGLEVTMTDHCPQWDRER